MLVTHGHSDHVSRHVLRQFVVASEETFKALAARLGALPPRRIATAPGKVLEIGDVQVAVLEAGHIIGSVMYLVEVGEFRFYSPATSIQWVLSLLTPLTL